MEEHELERYLQSQFSAPFEEVLTLSRKQDWKDKSLHMEGVTPLPVHCTPLNKTIGYMFRFPVPPAFYTKQEHAPEEGAPHDWALKIPTYDHDPQYTGYFVMNNQDLFVGSVYDTYSPIFEFAGEVCLDAGVALLYDPSHENIGVVCGHDNKRITDNLTNIPVQTPAELLIIEFARQTHVLRGK